MIAALTLTGSAWGSLMLACHRRLGGGVVRWLMADEEDRSSGSATFAAACRTLTCCEIACAEAFRVGCVKTHGALVRASAAKWYVPCCRNVRRHALHDINFCHWAHGRDNFALCFAHFGKPYEMTRCHVCYAMQGRSLSRTRFTVMFQ